MYECQSQSGAKVRARVDEEDVLEAARGSHGLENMQQIKYAVLERGGSISVIPRSGET